MMKIEQIAVGGFDSNFSYIVYDEKSGDSAIVDPCGNTDLIKAEIAACKRLFPKYILLSIILLTILRYLPAILFSLTVVATVRLPVCLRP
jgi:glyoxylase-like metal-dependent hydrolase (beta-lactamase superfamily II)